MVLWKWYIQATPTKRSSRSTVWSVLLLCWYRDANVFCVFHTNQFYLIKCIKILLHVDSMYNVIKSELIAITLFRYYWLFHIRLIGIYNRGTIHIHVLLYVNSYLRVLILTRSDIELSLLNSMKNKYFMSNIIVQLSKDGLSYLLLTPINPQSVERLKRRGRHWISDDA